MLTNKKTFIKQNRTKQINWLILFGIILVSANLRGPFTSVGSLLTLIREDLAVSHTLIGSLTTLPLIAFALLSPFVPKISERFGMAWAVFFALLLIMFGAIVRSLFGVTSLFIGTALIGCGIAIGNVLLPAFVKMNYPLQIGIMTGIYGISMNVFGALGAGVSVPLASIQGFGWKGALSVWAIVSLFAIIVWMPQVRSGRKVLESDTTPSKGSMWRSPLAWAITLFMGFQSFVFYTYATWVPDFLQANGFQSSTAGWMLFLMQFSIIPMAFITPLIAERMKNQIKVSMFVVLLFIIGTAGLLSGQQIFVPIAMISIGVGCGSAFSVSMMFFSLRTSNGREAAEISGMAQSFGYLLAAIGPILFGGLYDLTNSWMTPLVMMLIVTAIIAIAGYEAGKDQLIHEAK